MNTKQHWETVYTNKQPHEVSWTQNFPNSSEDIFDSLSLPKDVAIIDIGGGDSQFMSRLISKGYKNISVLDISGKSLERAKILLGESADDVVFIEVNIVEFETDQTFDFWHDRAVFHFLTTPEDIATYKNLVSDKVKPNAWFLIGTFSDNGPLKCSGLEITQYSEQQLIDKFSPEFQIIKSFQEEHKTPFDTIQNFQFCLFQRVEN